MEKCSTCKEELDEDGECLNDECADSPYYDPPEENEE